ncbi:MAG TPA: maleylacetoacetate isomerase [Sphingomicrobium sp.]
MSRPIFYEAPRSSAAYRVRIALNLKGIDYESRPVNLLEGEQTEPEYRELNPQGLVPMLDIDGHRLTQSLAIIVYLDQCFPEPPLVPRDPADGAHVRAMALAVACDIHPLNNLRVLKYLKHDLGQEQEAIDRWYAHWVREGFDALEAIARPGAGTYLFGEEPTITDVCLVPQLFNARRFNVPVDDYPTLLRAEANANKLDAFAAAHPDRQKVPA